jgi:hypothetical protein
MSRPPYVRYVAAAVLAVSACVLTIHLLFVLRAVFSPREQRFLNERPLTEEVAIELARGALEGEGIDTKMLVPLQREDGRIFMRGPDENRGYIQWFSHPDVQPDRRRGFRVSIEKFEGEYRCRAFRSK